MILQEIRLGNVSCNFVDAPDSMLFESINSISVFGLNKQDHKNEYNHNICPNYVWRVLSLYDKLSNDYFCAVIVSGTKTLKDKLGFIKEGRRGYIFSNKVANGICFFVQ
jgi:hypothetical protein